MIYEFKGGGLVAVGVPANDWRNNLVIGTVLQMVGYDEPKMVIVKNERINERYEYSGAMYKTIDLKTGGIRNYEAYTLKPLNEKKDGRIAVYITDQVLSADEIMDAIQFAKVKNFERIREVAAKDQAKAAELDRIKKDYAFLKPAEDCGKSGRVIGAANIRTELKKAFPGVKFSVRSDSFSMGNSIDIDWPGGPSRAEVEAITDKYEYGTFDSMTDCSGYKDEQFTKVYGGAKFVQTQRYEVKDSGGGETNG